MKTKLLLALFAVLLTAPLFAESFQVGDLYYNTIASNEVEIIDDAGDSYSNLTAVTIPETITYKGKTYSVTSIGDYAFSYCSGLQSIIIPNSVTSIGDAVFHSCSGLKSITIPNSVMNIGNFAFLYCI